jgi:Ca-activated chloride channel family protein
MDEMTDMGKGAYLYVDSEAEAERMFADPVRFLSNLSIVARNVQVEVTLPWYFGIKKFSGEEFASTPEEIEPQHLAPNDTMNFHQVIESCAAGLASKGDEVRLHVTYVDPIDGSPHEATRGFSMQELIDAPATQLHKADVVVNYAEALIQIADKVQQGDLTTARDYATNMAMWLDDAASALQDLEVQEMAELMTTYSQSL